MSIKTLLFSFIALLCLSCSRPLSLAFSVPDQMEFQYKSLNITNTTSKVMGMDMEANSVQEFDYTMKDLGKNADGNHRIGLNYDYIRTQQAAMGNEMIYDSKGPKEANDLTTAPLYDAMLANPFELIYTPQGSIVEAPGMDKMLDAMFNEMAPEVRAGLEAQLNADMFLQLFQSMNKFTINRTLKKGDTWQQSESIAMMGMIMDIDITYTLSSRQDGEAIIKIDGLIATNPESPGMEMMGMMMTYDLTGTQTGLLVVEESTNWPLRMSVDQQMGGTISVDNEATGPMQIDMVIDTDVSLERL